MSRRTAGDMVGSSFTLWVGSSGDKLIDSQQKIHQTKQKKPESETDFKCTTCNLCFCRKYTLSMHMLTHVTTRSFQCGKCEKAFKRRTDLTRHMHFHSPKKPSLCPYCGKIFTFKGSVNTHIRKIHLGQRSFTCEICNKTLLTLNGLKRHKRVHTNERVFKCDVCQQCFNWKETLKKHMKNHFSRNPSAGGPMTE